MEKIGIREALLIYLQRSRCVVRIGKSNDGTSWGILIGRNMPIKDLKVIEPFVIQTGLSSKGEAIQIAIKQLKRVIRVGKKIFTDTSDRYNIYRFMYFGGKFGFVNRKSKEEWEKEYGSVFGDSVANKIILALQEDEPERNFEEYLGKIFGKIAEYNNLTGID